VVATTTDSRYACRLASRSVKVPLVALFNLDTEGRHSCISQSSRLHATKLVTCVPRTSSSLVNSTVLNVSCRLQIPTVKIAQEDAKNSELISNKTNRQASVNSN
jgi:hypothetical protein